MFDKITEKAKDIYWSSVRFLDDLKIALNGKMSILKYGFNTHDCWSLDYSMCKWLLPRLKHFKKVNNGHPACNDLNGKEMTWEMWNYYVSLIIYWCEKIVNNDEPIYMEKPNSSYPEWNSEENRIAKRTFDLGEKCFHTYFHNLWW